MLAICNTEDVVSYYMHGKNKFVLIMGQVAVGQFGDHFSKHDLDLLLWFQISEANFDISRKESVILFQQFNMIIMEGFAKKNFFLF